MTKIWIVIVAFATLFQLSVATFAQQTIDPVGSWPKPGCPPRCADGLSTDLPNPGSPGGSIFINPGQITGGPSPNLHRDPVSGTYRGKMYYYLLLVAGGNRSFAQDITLTINPPSGGSFHGTLIDDAQSKSFPVQGQFGGNSVDFQVVFADSNAGRLEMTFYGVLTGGGSIRGNFKVRGNLWQQTVNQIRAENGSVVDVVPSSFELRQ